MRRIEQLDTQEAGLTSLPDLPSFDVDYTLADNSPARAPLQPNTNTTNILPQGLANPSPSHKLNLLPANANPYTSTPAPTKALHRSGPGTASSRQSDRTVGASSNASTARAGQHYPKMASARPRTGDVLESQFESSAELDTSEVDHSAALELPSFDGGSIRRTASFDSTREEMEVVSGSAEGSSLTHGAGTGPSRRASSSAVASLAVDLTEPSLAPPSLPDLDSPARSAQPAREYIVPLAGDTSDDDTNLIPASERAKRLANASGHLSFGRGRKSGLGAIQSLPHPDATTDDDTGLLSANTSISPKTSRGRVSPSIGTRHLAPATPAPAPASDPAVKRRAEHLLATLQATSKKPLKRGTPHTLARQMHSPAFSNGHLPSPEQADHTAADTTSTSSHDLTTFQHAGNNSLPSGGLDARPAGGAGRFNQGKLNAYLHSLNGRLATENQDLAAAAADMTTEITRLQRDKSRLEEQVREMSRAGSSMTGFQSRTVDESDALDEGPSRIELIGQQLAGVVKQRAGRAQLEDDLTAELSLSGTPRVRSGAPSISPGLVSRLEARLAEQTTELDQIRTQLVNAREHAGDKSHTGLVSELQREVFELKDALGEATAAREATAEDLATARAEHASALNEVNARGDELLVELEERDAELAQARELLETTENEFAEKNRLLEAELSGLYEEQERKLDAARAEVGQGRAADEEERREWQEANEDAQNRINQLERELDALGAKHAEEMASLEDELDKVAAEAAEFERRAEEAAADAASLEEALDVSANQQIEKDDQISALRAQLSEEQRTAASLSTQLGQLRVPKAKSPLSYELGSSMQNDQTAETIARLEAELEEAHDAVELLQEQLAAANPSVLEVKEVEIQTLAKSKAELEERVEQLRQQVAVQLTPRKGSLPEQSILFKSILGLATPKTPGALLGTNLANYSVSSSIGDATISPLLAQITELEQIVGRLQAELAKANGNIDDKLGKLEAAGQGTIDLTQQLVEARDRADKVERALERISCTGCGIKFDARESVLSAAGRIGSPSVNASLRSALAGVNAKVNELRGDHTADLVSSHAALQQDFAQARAEIAGLENELQTERFRLRTLADDHKTSSTAKATLEARLVAAEHELRAVKRDLTGAHAPDALDRLRRDKSTLVSERADLLQKLTTVNQRVSAVDTDLSSTKASQRSTQLQLEQQLAAVAALRASLSSREAANRHLQDERGDILKGVSSLQADLDRVRRNAVALGDDLAHAKRERDALSAQSGAGREEQARLVRELAQARGRLAVFEQKVAAHVCPADAGVLAEAGARHAREAKGLLVMIHYLKARVTREATFRGDLQHQKRFLGASVEQKQAAIDHIMSELGVAKETGPARVRVSLKGAVRAVVAVARMERLSREWRAQGEGKSRLRGQAYPDTRGRPFVG